MGERSKPSQRPRRFAAPRRGTLAIAASIAAHAAVWLLSPFQRLPPPSPTDAVTIEIVTPPPPPPASPSPSPSPSASPSPSPRRRPPAPPRSPSAAPAPSTHDPESSLSLRPPEHAPLLPPGPLPLPTADQLARAGITLEAPPPPPRGPSKWERDMARIARTDAARANVRAGLAPPATFELLREIERRYEPSNDVVVAMAKAEAGRARSTSRWLHRYLGGFLDHDPTENGKAFTPDAAFRRAMRGSTLEYASRMCVTFTPEGAPVVEKEGGSGIPSLDRLAHDVVVQAAERRRPGFEGPVRACFRFSARLERVPPLPVLFCGLNKNWMPECIYPLKEITSTRVVLDGVELGAQATLPSR